VWKTILPKFVFQIANTSLLIQAWRRCNFKYFTFFGRVEKIFLYMYIYIYIYIYMKIVFLLEKDDIFKIISMSNLYWHGQKKIRNANLDKIVFLHILYFYYNFLIKGLYLYNIFFLFQLIKHIVEVWKIRYIYIYIYIYIYAYFFVYFWIV